MVRCGHQGPRKLSHVNNDLSFQGRTTDAHIVLDCAGPRDGCQVVAVLLEPLGPCPGPQGLLLKWWYWQDRIFLLKRRRVRRWEERERVILHLLVTPQMSRSQERNSGLPCRWQKLKHLSHHCYFPKEALAGGWNQGVEPGVELKYSHFRCRCPKHCLKHLGKCPAQGRIFNLQKSNQERATGISALQEKDIKFLGGLAPLKRKLETWINFNGSQTQGQRIWKQTTK